MRENQGYAFRVEFSACKDSVILHGSQISGQIAESENIGFTSKVYTYHNS